MPRQMHLDKGPKGMAARTACGRSILRTPMSTDWVGFKSEPRQYQCTKCLASKQAELNARRDAQLAAA
jgi:hypothetical protein